MWHCDRLCDMPTLAAASDSSSGLSLAVRLQENSSQAWREFVELYGPLIESWCHRLGVAESARADIGQEVFLSVHRGIVSFDPRHPRATFRGWLWTITRNAIWQWRRRQEPEGAGGSTAQALLADISDPWEQSDGQIPPNDSHDMATLISRALDQIRAGIAEQTWNAFWHTTVLGHSAAEAGQELGMTPLAVRQAKSRVLRRLRKQLGDA